ncbi:hemerythrin domain-containing protein [Blastococcus sp. SYSU D00813]
MTTERPMTTAPAVPQVRLPGQEAAPEGPVDLLMMYALHHAFRRTLADVAAAVPVTPVADVTAWRAMHDYWTRSAEVLHHHHTGEDTVLWPLLLRRCDAAGDRVGRATLEAMAAEHEQIDPLLAACEAGLAAMAAGGTADRRGALAVRAIAARDALARHLAHEETEALAIVQATMTDAEWQELERTAFPPPRTPAEVAFSVPWVCRGLPADVRDRAFAARGRVLRVAWVLTRRRFDRLHRRAFGAAG